MQAAKLDAGRVTQSTAVTEAGYAADARLLNAALPGTLAQKVGSLEERTKGLNVFFGKYYAGENIYEFIENVISDLYDNYSFGVYMFCGGWDMHDAASIYAGKFSNYVSAIVCFRESIYFARRNGNFFAINDISKTDAIHKEYP